MESWEFVENDSNPDDFANKLMGAKIIDGYRRYVITGAGLGPRKKGARWVSTNTGNFNRLVCGRLV